MKEKTLLQHRQIANDALYYIYRHIDTDINIDMLCSELGVSRFHFQRLFKAQTGENLYETIKSIRLQKAASLLLTNRYATMSQVASMCGYGSQSSFIRAFRTRFGMSPGVWRRGGFQTYAEANIATSEAASASNRTFAGLEAKIVRTDPMHAYYIRHRGYSPKVKEVWQKLQAWRYTHGIERFTEIGLYHDNPTVTPLSESLYVAAVAVEERDAPKDSILPSFTIPGGLYARFDVEGRYGDILRLIRWAYHEWLPQSGYETTTMPSFTIFEKNHFLEEDGGFRVRYHLPVRLV